MPTIARSLTAMTASFPAPASGQSSRQSPKVMALFGIASVVGVGLTGCGNLIHVGGLSSGRGDDALDIPGASSHLAKLYNDAVNATTDVPSDALGLVERAKIVAACTDPRDVQVLRLSDRAPETRVTTSAGPRNVTQIHDECQAMLTKLRGTRAKGCGSRDAHIDRISTGGALGEPTVTPSMFQCWSATPCSDVAAIIATPSNEAFAARAKEACGAPAVAVKFRGWQNDKDAAGRLTKQHGVAQCVATESEHAGWCM